MTGSRLALVADDQRFASTIQVQLRKALGQAALSSSYGTIRNYLGRETDGVLLLTANSAAEAEQALRLVQEIYLQKLSTMIVVVEGTDLPPDRQLTSLTPYVAQRLRWPDDATTLVQLLRDRLGRVRHPVGATPDTVEEVISRRLLNQTPSLLPLVERIAIASVHDVTVLLTGETGTGKTHLARLMHDCSPRKAEPFMVVACGAQTANLIESAFFGHVRGAFTGADRDKVGKFEAAGHGTILLDEIDTLGMEQQASLLRVIETGEFEPVGSNETRHCTARIIVASNWDLEEAVLKGKFRQDLYYRLNVMSFHLPSLRERVQDIAPLARGMTARFNTRFRKELYDICLKAMDVLEAFPWPGNIRQLENAVQQAVLVSSGPELRYEHLPPQIRDHKPTSREPASNGKSNSLLHSREMNEKNVIERALASTNGSRAKAASALGISRVTLYKKMKKYGLMESPAQPDESSIPD
jgi:two-component system, NtrC family, response regulator HydG